MITVHDTDSRGTAVISGRRRGSTTARKARQTGFCPPIRQLRPQVRATATARQRRDLRKLGAPRRSRTYNPLAGSRVISSALPSASALVSGGVPGLRSSLMLGQSASDSNVSVDQSGRSITRTREIDDVILDAVRLAGPGDGRRPARIPDTASLRDCARVSGTVTHTRAVLGGTRQAGEVLLACRGASRPRARCHSGTEATCF